MAQVLVVRMQHRDSLESGAKFVAVLPFRSDHSTAHLDDWFQSNWQPRCTKTILPSHSGEVVITHSTASVVRSIFFCILFHIPVFHIQKKRNVQKHHYFSWKRSRKILFDFLLERVINLLVAIWPVDYTLCSTPVSHFPPNISEKTVVSKW